MSRAAPWDLKSDKAAAGPGEQLQTWRSGGILQRQPGIMDPRKGHRPEIVLETGLGGWVSNCKSPRWDSILDRVAFCSYNVRQVGAFSSCFATCCCHVFLSHQRTDPNCSSPFFCTTSGKFHHPFNGLTEGKIYKKP